MCSFKMLNDFFNVCFCRNCIKPRRQVFYSYTFNAIKGIPRLHLKKVFLLPLKVLTNICIFSTLQSKDYKLSMKKYKTRYSLVASISISCCIINNICIWSGFKKNRIFPSSPIQFRYKYSELNSFTNKFSMPGKIAFCFLLLPYFPVYFESNGNSDGNNCGRFIINCLGLKVCFIFKIK